MWVGGRRRRRRRHRIPADDDCSPPSQSAEPAQVDRAQTMAASRSGGGPASRAGSKYWMVLASSAAFFALIAQNLAAGTGMMVPAWRTQYSATGMARNIRHLPCVSRRTGETGLCMFAYSCAKANGTHLGTCIDRFYFGSCCKISPNNEVEVAEPLDNYLNKEDYSSSSKRPTFLPDFSAISSTYPPTSGLPSSLADLFTSSTTFIKATGSSTTGSTTKPTSMHTISSLSFETIPITSRTPLVNVTMSQSYSTPLSHVTASPLVYSTTVSTVFQGSTHRPAGVSSSTTGYSKPLTKPTSKPNKTKPPIGKPGTSKPKPPKLPPKPSTAAPNRTTSFSTSLSSSSSSYKPTYVAESTVPTRLPSRPSTQSIPTPITLFTSSKRPPKPTKTPSTVVYTTTTTTSAPPSSYVKIPVSTVGQSRPTTSLPPSPSTSYPSSSIDDLFSRVNATGSSSAGTEKPLKPWQTSSIVSWTSAAPTTSPFSSSSTYTTSSSSTSSQPSLVTWTIDHAPDVILPDRTKPTSMVKPSGRPPVTRPTSFFPTFSKPISSSEKTTSRPDLFKPATKPEVDSTVQSSTASPPWVEVPVTTHAPTASVPSTSSESPEGITWNVMPLTTTKPSTSITIPVSSPLPLQTTSSPPIDHSELVNMSDYRDVCGRRLFSSDSQPTGRIVGGAKSSFGKWPWQISLRQWRTSTYLHKCGAALFNENWAVTAAHCVENVSPSDLLLRLGEHDLAVEDEPFGYQERRVPFMASHPQFDPRTFEYDLALLRFDEPVKFQPNIIPICVPEDDTNFVGSEAFVTGWGRLYEDGPLPSVLQEVSVPVINNSVCENMYQAAGYIEHIPNIFICAGWKKGGFDSCEGDSGGPMVIQRPDKRWLLAGIISWGIGCAEPNQPGVYTRISEFRDWINQILQY